jgi:hypothetical protein
MGWTRNLPGVTISVMCSTHSSMPARKGAFLYPSSWSVPAQTRVLKTCPLKPTQLQRRAARMGMTLINETGSRFHTRTTELFICLPDCFPLSFKHVINSGPLGYLLAFINLCRHLVTDLQVFIVRNGNSASIKAWFSAGITVRRNWNMGADLFPNLYVPRSRAPVVA